jgi:hypothetical protein
VKVCYAIGLFLCVFSVYMIVWRTNLAEWTDPESYHTVPAEDWSPEFRVKAETVIHPYQEMGIILLVFAATAFLLVLTIILLVARASARWIADRVQLK